MCPFVQMPVCPFFPYSVFPIFRLSICPFYHESVCPFVRFCIFLSAGPFLTLKATLTWYGLALGIGLGLGLGLGSTSMVSGQMIRVKQGPLPFFQLA